ncbi:5385_t:CDS:2 [Acaulospora morrowiae]|uniref:DNA damage-binding protein CMR1 n=1 Tax=Acaulospora morrowiae TaxID=94023 RepID=A0A9N9F924_9GLOM|nr:5385_t:CDS:2 [Acaulospora morrowiae]
MLPFLYQSSVKDLTPSNYALPYVTHGKMQKEAVSINVESAFPQVTRELGPLNEIDITSVERSRKLHAVKSLPPKPRPSESPFIPKIGNPSKSNSTKDTRVSKGISKKIAKNEKKETHSACVFPYVTFPKPSGFDKWSSDLFHEMNENSLTDSVFRHTEPDKTLVIGTWDESSGKKIKSYGSTISELVKNKKCNIQGKNSSKKKSRTRSFSYANLTPLATRNELYKEVAIQEESDKQNTEERIFQQPVSLSIHGSEDLDELFRGNTYYSISTAMQSIDITQDTRIIWNSFPEQWTQFWLKRPCVLLRDFSRIHRLHEPVYCLTVGENKSYWFECFVGHRYFNPLQSCFNCWVENDAIDYVSIQAFEVLCIEFNETPGSPTNKQAQCKHEVVIDNRICPTSDINQQHERQWIHHQKKSASFWERRPCVLLFEFCRLHSLPTPIYSLSIQRDSGRFWFDCSIGDRNFSPKNQSCMCCWVQNDAIDHVSIQAFESVYAELCIRDVQSSLVLYENPQLCINRNSETNYMDKKNTSIENTEEKQENCTNDITSHIFLESYSHRLKTNLTRFQNFYPYKITSRSTGEMNTGGESTLNAYERQRLENIRRNEEILRQLNIPELITKKTTPKSKPKPKQKFPKKEPSLPTRKSLRIQGFKADGPEAKRKAEEETKNVKVTTEKRVRKEGDLDLGSVRSEDMSLDDTKHFLGVLMDLTKFKTGNEPEGIKNEDIDYSTVVGGEQGLRSVRSVYKKLIMGLRWPSVSVTPERIYCMAVHPATDKILVAAGDKVGSLGFWDVKDKVKSEYDNDDDEPRTYMFEAHTKTIISTKYLPIDSNQLFTCSYDGSIRYMDLNKAKFMEALVSRDQLSCIDFHPSSKVMYFSTNEGKFGIKDLREPIETYRGYTLHDKKIGCVSVNPIKPELLVTSSLEKSLRLWDVRNLKDQDTHIQEIPFRYSVTSAYWSPNGDQVVSTSFDDTVRVFDLDGRKLKLRLTVPHDNQTGRWVTMLRATWNPNPNVHPHFIIGNMRKSADIISGVNGELIWNMRDKQLTTIPAVNAFHPTLNFIASGNASGKMFSWEEEDRSDFTTAKNQRN